MLQLGYQNPWERPPKSMETMQHSNVCCVLHRVSQTVCPLPGSGRGIETELQSDEPAFDGQQHRK